ncbi:MAG: glutamine synthetase family protein [Planctomycetaceae bacterium]
MAEPPGMLTRDELAEGVSEGGIETVLAVFPDLYGRLVGKRFDARHFNDIVTVKGTHACDYLLTVDMEMEPVAGYRFANWDSGYGDIHLTPDFATLRVASWLDRTAMVLCDLADEQTRQPVPCAPRSMLRRQIDRASSLRLEAMAGSELEYYLFNTSYRDAATANHSDAVLEPAGWYIEDYHALQGTREEPFNAAVRRHLANSGVPVECTKGEWGRGQHELNVRYADVLRMADNHTVYKQCLKEVADQQQISVTFMAKYSADGAGSSCHVHLSLWRDGENAFAGSETCGPVSCSDLFRWFLAGWMDRVPELMVFYAPNVNSYKRYRPGSWAPTRIGWSRDNRTAGFRVVGSGDGLRIECRIPGADCNPYLTYTAALASGLDGIARQLEPPVVFDGNVYEADELPHVPRTLTEAAGEFERSDFARSALGADVVEHYLHFFRTEQAAYDRAVTDWERRRYFERI